MSYLERWTRRGRKKFLRRYFNRAITIVPFLFRQGDLVISLKQETDQEPGIMILTLQIFFKEQLMNEYHYIKNPSA